MGKILSHIPGFRTGTPRHMALAGAYYLLSLSMMLVSAALGLLLLSGPFLIFNGYPAIAEYTESKNTRALTALFVSAAICGGSLIGFVADMAGRPEPLDTAALMVTATPDSMPAATVAVAQTPEAALPPSPTGLPLERAIVLGFAHDRIHVQFADESASDIILAGIKTDAPMIPQAVDYMEETLPPGSIVYLEEDTNGDGSGYFIWMEEPFSFHTEEVRRKTLNSLLVASGYAAAADTTGGKYTEVLIACQEDAQAACVGLWAAATATPAATLIPTPAPTPIPAPSPSPEAEQTPAAEDPPEEPAEPPAGEVHYCGSINSDVFHLSTCGSAGRISDKNMVIYKSREDALRRGKRPCKKCKP